MGDMNAYQGLANTRNSLGDNSTDGVMVAASAAKASTDPTLRPRAKLKKSQSKIKSKTAKTRSS
jgi:hypothetical protein